MWFSADNFFLTFAQAACIALVGAGLPLWAERYRARGWALIAPLSIGVVIGAIALIPQTADLLTWVALILVPIGAALAFGWAIRGRSDAPARSASARGHLAWLAVPLLALAWAYQDERIGQIAATILIAASAITAGRLLAGVAPITLLKIGIVVMAIIDSILVFSNQLQGPNAVLEAASPGAGLPQFQALAFGHAGLGYGDVFAAAVVGAIIAVERGPQLLAAVAMLVVTLAWDQLFLIYNVLPATVPPAIVLVAWWLGRDQFVNARQRSWPASVNRAWPTSATPSSPSDSRTTLRTNT